MRIAVIRIRVALAGALLGIVTPGAVALAMQNDDHRDSSLQATVSAYSWQEPGNGADGAITRSGTVAHWGTVAVDPHVIPLGSRLQIEGYDTVFTAEDTGGAVVGNRIEIFFPDEGAALAFGVRSLTVTLVNERGSIGSSVPSR